MAESRPVEGIEGDKRTLGTENIGSSIPECAVCLQTCVHPAQLPCGHIFCFLCVKGVANQSKKCAMCRQEIPADYFEKPVLVGQNNTDKDSAGFDGGYQWFYEGRNGWWLYDERTSMDLEEMFKLGESSCEMLICGTLYVIDFKNSQQYRKREPTKKRRIKRDLKTAESWWQYDERTSRELEAAYKKGERICELLVAGLLYIADFDAMLQIRRNDPSRRRRIKRDLATIPKKGVAGLRLEGYQQALGEQGEEEVRPKSPALQGTTDGAMTPTPVPPTNTPQTPAGGTASGETTPDQQESLHRAVEQIRSLSFRDDVTALDDSDGNERGSGDEDQELPDFSGVIPSPWVLTFFSDEDLL